MYDTATTAVMLGIIAALYILPTILAFGRDHAHRQVLALVNLLFGWTLVGWVGVFLWALLARPGTGES